MASELLLCTTTSLNAVTVTSPIKAWMTSEAVPSNMMLPDSVVIEISPLAVVTPATPPTVRIEISSASL